MNSHKNARLGFTGRVCLDERFIQDRWSAGEAAKAFGVSERTVRKWLARFRSEGQPGLRDRNPRPRRSPRQIAPSLERRIAHFRQRRLSGPAIADRLSLPLSTVGDVLRRLGLGRLPPLVPRPPIIRYERDHPGELLHIDTKKLGRIVGVGHRIHGDRSVRVRGIGWEVLHVAITMLLA